MNDKESITQDDIIDNDKVLWEVDSTDENIWEGETTTPAAIVHETSLAPTSFIHQKNGPLYALVALILVILLIAATQYDSLDFWTEEDDNEKDDSPLNLEFQWQEPVWMPRAVVDPENGQYADPDFPILSDRLAPQH